MNDELIVYGGLFVLLGFFLLVWVCTNIGLDIGKGRQTGYIGEVERSGIFWRPPEVRLISVNPTFSEYDTAWHYGIEKNLAPLAEEYVRNHTKVTVYYRVERHVWSWDYANRDIIYKIEPVEGKE